MAYTNFILLVLGFAGILLHCLVEINKLNHQPNGNFNPISYLKVEWASLLISFIAVAIAVILKEEISALEFAGKWLGAGFVALGYMAQSILIAVMGKAQKTIDKITDNDTTA